MQTNQSTAAAFWCVKACKRLHCGVEMVSSCAPTNLKKQAVGVQMHTYICGMKKIQQKKYAHRPIQRLCKNQAALWCEKIQQELYGTTNLQLYNCTAQPIYRSGGYAKSRLHCGERNESRCFKRLLQSFPLLPLLRAFQCQLQHIKGVNHKFAAKR